MALKLLAPSLKFLHRTTTVYTTAILLSAPVLALDSSIMDAWRQRLLLDIESWAESDSDDDIEQFFADLVEPQPTKRGGSVLGRGANLDRDRVSGHERIMKGYFFPRPVFTNTMFSRRFRMRFAYGLLASGQYLFCLIKAHPI